MNIVQRYKSIVALSVSDIHSHRPVAWLGLRLSPEGRAQFDTLQQYAHLFLSTRKPKEEILLDITDLSKCLLLYFKKQFCPHYLSEPYMIITIYIYYHSQEPGRLLRVHGPPRRVHRVSSHTTALHQTRQRQIIITYIMRNIDHDVLFCSVCIPCIIMNSAPYHQDVRCLAEELRKFSSYSAWSRALSLHIKQGE